MIVLGDIPRKNAKLYPECEALVCEDTHLTHRQFNERVNRLANGLAGLGIGKGDKVAAILLNCHRYIEIYFACAKLGAVTVPLNYRLALDELAYIIEHSESRALLADADHLPIGKELASRMPGQLQLISLDHAQEGWLDYEELLSRSSAAEPDVEVGEDDLCQIIYTGGTTGRPKGVMISHRNYMTSAYGSALVSMIGTRTFVNSTLMVLPIFHVSWWPVLTMLYVGGKVVIGKRFDFAEILATAEREKVEHINLVPVLFSWILAFPELDSYDLSSIKSLSYAGAPMPADVLKRCIAKFGPIFQQGYGLSEAAPLGTTLLPEDHIVDGPPELLRRLESAGRESPVTEVRVVDENDVEVPFGEIGEIVIRGKNVMQGYWKQPELSAQVLRGGWLHTGDLATRDEDGYIYIVDRKNDMIITGGENVYPFEVEKVLYEHPAILEAAVVGIPDDTWGERVTAAVTLKDGRQATEAELTAFIRERIAGYKTPKHVVFLESIPKTPVGKILRREVRELLAEPGG